MSILSVVVVVVVGVRLTSSYVVTQCGLVHESVYIVTVYMCGYCRYCSAIRSVYRNAWAYNNNGPTRTKGKRRGD